MILVSQPPSNMCFGMTYRLVSKMSIVLYINYKNIVKIRAVVQVLTRKRRNLWLKPKEKERDAKQIMREKGIPNPYLISNVLTSNQLKQLKGIHFPHIWFHWLYFWNCFLSCCILLEDLYNINGLFWPPIYSNRVHVEYESVISTKHWRSWVVCAVHTWNRTNHKRSWESWTWPSK